MKDFSSFPGSAASPETDYVNATLVGDDPWLKLKVELLLVYGYLPRPPENHSDFGSFTELVCMWFHPSGNLSFVDAAVIVECRDVCRKGELQLAQFRPSHVCGAIKLIKQMEIRYVLCSCLLTYLCHDKLHSLVKAHMRSMERNSQIPAIVDHILLIMIFDGVAMKLRYVGIHSTSLGFLYGLMPTKTNPDVFSSRFQYHEVSWSVCDFDFGLTLLLSSVSLSQRLSSHDYKLSLWSTSLVMQRIQKIQKQLRVVGFCCTPLEFLFGSLPWYLVDHPNPHDFTYGQGEFWFAPAIELLWFHNIWFVLLSLHEQQIIVKDGLWLLCTKMELVFSAKRPWVTPLCFELVHFNERPMVQQNQFCLKSLPSQEGAAIRVSTELISVTRTWSLHGFLLFTVMLNANGDEDFAKRWTMFHNGCHATLQNDGLCFIMVATFLYKVRTETSNSLDILLRLVRVGLNHSLHSSTGLHQDHPTIVVLSVLLPSNTQWSSQEHKAALHPGPFHSILSRLSVSSLFLSSSDSA